MITEEIFKSHGWQVAEFDNPTLEDHKFIKKGNIMGAWKKVGLLDRNSGYYTSYKYDWVKLCPIDPSLDPLERHTTVYDGYCETEEDLLMIENLLRIG